MAEHSRSGPTNDYLISRSTEVDDDYSVWRIDIDGDPMLSLVHTGDKFDRKHDMISIGNYILEWGSCWRRDEKDHGRFSFRLFKFDPNSLR